MNQQQKIFCMVVGVILITLIGAGGTVLYHYRNVSIDLSPKGWLPDEDPKTANKPAFPWLSEEDMKVLRDPKAANKAAFEKMSREAWEHYQSQINQNGSNQGWKK
jgi:hypothetical protein